MFTRFKNWLHRAERYVIADAKDNSITFSKRLCKDLDIFNLDKAKVFVCTIAGTKRYIFLLNPEIEQETQLADIQYNEKHKCIGFESLCPTVNRIFYDYGIPADIRVKLSVRQGKSADGKITYYEILKPDNGQ